MAGAGKNPEPRGGSSREADADSGRGERARRTSSSSEYIMTKGPLRPKPAVKLDTATPLGPPEIVVSRFAMQREEADDRLLLVRNPDSARAAAFRVLATRIESVGSPQVVVVSSSLPNEGKTTCATNLALALGECKRSRVLLIEASVRYPQLAQMFGFYPPACLAQQLEDHRNKPDERWAVVDIEPCGIHVAAIDTRTETRPQIDGPAFSFAISRLREAGYDHIVIDAPSVLGTAEVNLMQAASDGVILVVHANRSRSRDVSAAVDQLGRENILGTVLMAG
jgi:Mrp family chromosome partitioning ATPase